MNDDSPMMDAKQSRFLRPDSCIHRIRVLAGVIECHLKRARVGVGDYERSA